MSIIGLPPDLLVSQHSFGVRRYDLSFRSGDTGASQTVVLAPPRRTCSLTSPELVEAADAVRWRTLLHALGGRVNQLAVYDRLNPIPKGTARGMWTAAQAAPAGAKTLVINAGISGKTLLAGDWIGVNQQGTNRQLLHVQADAVVDPSGRMTVAFEMALRVGVAAGSLIVWDKPTCLMKCEADEASWSVSKGHQGGFYLDLMEHWF